MSTGNVGGGNDNSSEGSESGSAAAEAEFEVTLARMQLEGKQKGFLLSRGSSRKIVVVTRIVESDHCGQQALL